MVENAFKLCLNLNLFFFSLKVEYSYVTPSATCMSCKYHLISITHAICKEPWAKSMKDQSLVAFINQDERRNGKTVMDERGKEGRTKNRLEREVQLSGEENRAILKQKLTTSLHLLNFKKESQQLIHSSSLAFLRRDVETRRHCSKLAKRRRRKK